LDAGRNRDAVWRHRFQPVGESTAAHESAGRFLEGTEPSTRPGGTWLTLLSPRTHESLGRVGAAMNFEAVVFDAMMQAARRTTTPT
jgi:hypothetical protein